jgi:hypothetical protein
LAVFALGALSAFPFCAQTKRPRKPAITSELPASKPVASRIGPVYDPGADRNPREVSVDILADFVPSTHGPTSKLNLDEIRGSATLLCSDCESSKEVSPTNIRRFSEINAGITLVIAVETGSAMSGERLASVKQGLIHLFKEKRAKDKLALVSIGNDLHVLSEFSDTDQAQKQAIENLRIEPVPYPRLYRALTKTFDLFDQANKGFPQRRRLLIISTGRNEASAEQSAVGGFRDDDVIARANQANVVIDAIGVPAPLPPRTISLLPPKSIGFGDSQLQQQLERQRFQIPSGQSVDAYLDALEKIVRATGGLYLRQDPARSNIGDRMIEGVQWVNDTPVLTFDLSNAIPADGKKHRVALRLSTQPGRDFEAVVTMPAGRSWFHFSPVLILFILALVAFSVLILSRGSRPKHQAAAVAFAADLSDQAAEFPDPVSTDSGRSATVQGGTLREGFWGANTTGGSHLRIPGHDNIGGGGQAGFVPPRPGPAAPARSSTRVMTSWFPAPGSGSPCCSLHVIGGSCAGAEFSMDFSEVTIGREQDMNTFALPDPGISSHHATLRWNSGVVTITDDNSTNGTSVGGVRITPARPHPLQIGDQIQIGSTVMVVELRQSTERG